MTIAPQTGPLCTRESLASELRALGVRPAETLLVHSSLSALGWVCGGPVAVIEALLDVLGPRGTLVVPTHSADNSDPAAWRNPPVPASWWDGIRASTPAFDTRTTRSLGVGVIPETLRTWPGALRSVHPQTSFAALGPRAAGIVDGHALDCRFGEHSPLARLEEAGAGVLLLGAGFDSCSAFHLAEYRVPAARVTNSFAVTTPQGRRWTTVEDTAISSDRFEELGADFEKTHPVLRGRVGGADTRLFGLPDAVTHAVEWIRENRRGTERF